MKGKRRTARGTPTSGFLYLVQCNGDDGPIKIGHAQDLDRRMHTLRIGCPYAIEQLASVWVNDDVQSIEAMLHERFASSWIRGEWYQCTPELLEVANRLLVRQANQIAEYLGAGAPAP